MSIARFSAIGLIAAGLAMAAASPRPQPHGAPHTLTDAEFWEFFTTMSEAGGTFASENFVSNEMSFEEVIPTLQRSLTPGGVYLGVGPEQNFTYIANLKPPLAVIFDIRRQNAMQHLMYKALFELSPTRAEFVSRLFSRPRVARLGTAVNASALFDSAAAAAPSDSAYRANDVAIMRSLTVTHGFLLSPDDLASIEHVYSVFHEAGPDVNYSYRYTSPANFRSGFPTYGTLQAVTNADSVQMAFLATEENYRFVRDLERRNLVIPVVGDFGGPKAIRAVGEYLRKRDLTVTAFYLSNVEQYLFREPGVAQQFYGNASSLPIDATSTFIRSVPRSGDPLMLFNGGPGTLISGSGGNFVGGFTSITVMDSGGVRTTRTVYDSAGTRLTRVAVDSAGRITNRVDSTRAAAIGRPDSAYLASLRAMFATRDSALGRFRTSSGVLPMTGVVMGGMLSSGLATMRSTLDAFFANRLQTYADVIAMTKTSGWK